MSVTEIPENIPIVGQAMKFARLAKNFTNTADPTQACVKAVKGIVIDCLPTHVKWPLKCIMLKAQVALAVNCDAPIAVALAIAT